MRRKLSLVGVVLVVLMMGCASLGINTSEMSAKDKYLAARIEFNVLLTQYLDYRDTADEATRDDLNTNVSPYFKKAEKALDAWGLVVKTGGDPSADETKYLNLKNELIDMLADIVGD